MKNLHQMQIYVFYHKKAPLKGFLVLPSTERIKLLEAHITFLHNLRSKMPAIAKTYFNICPQLLKDLPETVIQYLSQGAKNGL